jgi:tetratricopeptide (TPR) repeat protein
MVMGILGMARLVAAEPLPAPAGGEEMADRVPEVEEAIPAVVKALGEPVPMEFPGGLQMAVSGASDAVQRAVLQGINHLHGGWNFEASRHFAVAMREDPDCLMAHWGMVMALLVPTPETGAARNAAALRLADLVERGKGTRLERGYAYGLIKYLDEGPAAAANAFAKVAVEFPGDLQAPVFAALFGRSGYDAAGDPTVDQERAEKDLERLVTAHPGSLIPIHALLMIRAEGPRPQASLHLARKLCELAPNYPPFHHLLGHWEWRCGGHRAAAVALGRATGLFESWMRREKVTVADCPEWVRSECYRVVALFSAGDFDTALAAAEALAATSLAPERARSEGVRCALWEAKTLPARLLMARDGQGDTALAIASLPTPDAVKPFHGGCLAHWGIDGIRLVLETRRLLEAGKLEDARKAVAALDYHVSMMAKAQRLSLEGGERSAWIRSFRAFETLVFETRGKLALAGPASTRGGAYNWFRSAADSQTRATMLLPPLVLTPQLARVGLVLLAEGKAGDAREILDQALTLYPNNLFVLDGLRQALEALGKTAEAAATAERISRLRGD